MTMQIGYSNGHIVGSAVATGCVEKSENLVGIVDWHKSSVLIITSLGISSHHLLHTCPVYNLHMLYTNLLSYRGLPIGSASAMIAVLSLPMAGISLATYIWLWLLLFLQRIWELIPTNYSIIGMSSINIRLLGLKMRHCTKQLNIIFFYNQLQYTHLCFLWKWRV